MNKPVKHQEQVDIEAILGMEGTSASGWLHRPALRWGAAVVAGLLLLALAWSFVGSGRGVRYITEPVTRGDLTVIVTATGSVQPTNKVEVSSELSGTIRQVLVDYNSPVTAEQRLAELDTDKLQASLDSARAKLVAANAKVADAEATVVEKERDLARKKALEARHYTSTQDLDLAQAAYDRALATLASAKADVGVAEADLRLKETDLAKACICSPINGVVLERNVDPGQFVATSFQAPVLFTIAEDLRQMELQVDVDEADVGTIKIGQSASFSVDAFPDRKFPATIRDVRFASEIIQGVVTYKAVLDIDNSELLLRPGMTATAEIKATEITDALLVPNAALRFTPPVSDTAEDQSFLRRIIPGPPRFRPASQRQDTGANRTVWARRDGEPMPVKVVIGLSDGKRTQVLSGDIEVGQALIVDQTTSKP
jgi:HlyD family secretion protein